MKSIPDHFHFIFGLKPQLDEFHIAYYLCLKSCLEVITPKRISFYYHHQPYGEWWDRIKPELELVQIDLEEFIVNKPDYLRHREGQLIDALKLNYVHQAEFIRLRILVEQGAFMLIWILCLLILYPPNYFRTSLSSELKET